MKTVRILLALAFAVAAIQFATSTTQAQDCGYTNGLGFGYGLGYSRVYGQADPRIPFFALHPPVYYSRPVPRPYGFSPFALPPGIAPAEMQYVPQPVAEMKIIENPYVKSGASDNKKSSAPVTANGKDKTT